MGQIEDRIKAELMLSIFGDTSSIYDFIESRFDLDEKQRDAFIALLNQFNNDLSTLLKEVKLS
jgi:hypothetical protein